LQRHLQRGLSARAISRRIRALFDSCQAY
jgi:hypothetical protein